MNIYQAFFHYANSDIEILSRLKGQRMLHSIFGECIIQDVVRSKDDQSLLIHAYSSKLNDVKRIAASFLGDMPDTCLGLDIPQDLLPLLEKYREEQENQEKSKQELRQTQEQERRLQEHQRLLREKFRLEVEKLYNAEIGVIHHSPELTEKDIRLAWIWRDHIKQADMPQILKSPLPDLSESKDYKWGQMLSARAAEKAVGSLFAQIGCAVQDVSISQLDPQNDGMWRQCDLVIDDRQIDVKNGRNARRHDSDAFDNYIEFCVPRYKHDDRNDQHVWIVGALSNYLWASSLMCADNFPYSTQIRILGWTQKKLIQDLSERFNIPNHFNITFSRRGNSYTYLPPWAFVYPEKFYSSRDGYLASIFSDNQLVNILDMTYPISYPFFIAFGKDPFDTGILKPVESWEVSFAELLTNWTQEQEHKHSLPFLFASVLNHFIHMVLADRNEISNFSPDRYRKFLYVMGLNKFPLMIYDPLETINNLIKVLDLLWTSDTDKLLEYKSFKLTNALILKGYKDSNEEADTLVAYCGGRLEDNSACGYYPLVAGQDPTCPNCHHLICSDCNYCSYECCPDGHGFARPELTEHYSHKFTRVFDHPSPYDLEEADDDIPF